ncbi:thiol peroxidase [Oceanidesulfovibrio indonesiensis]|uniref:Thiol peroxidase n=1 Tax=Oceanidesulfovibrio indonesiensis TaxID=54767 RepID=A0A7M3MCN1_9BACT|nr:thiol peroxidase [Oceanidesulfovibrio indonesiensis]TVM15815.1 thiol peroxidase [Oceanidesulfovibrio indonesiensis]
MPKRTGVVTFQGDPLTLTGDQVGLRQLAPAFTAIKPDLSSARLSDYSGKKLIIASVPSLDTSVCSMETKRFNDEAKNLGDDVELLIISMDLPFAQARWQQEHDATEVTLLSDHRSADFGHAYGVLIKELRLLARAVFVVGSDGRIVYDEIVKEITDQPDYSAVLDAVRSAS